MRARILIAAAAVALAGCGKDEPIRVYMAPTEPTWRMIAAMRAGSSGAGW